VDPTEVELHDVEAAVLLHAHVGLLALREVLPVEAAVHFSSARRLLEWAHAVARRRREDPVGGFLAPRIEERDFYLGLTGSSLALWGLSAAERFADAGLRRLPTDADILLVSGCVQEAMATEHSASGRGGEARRAIEQAAKLFHSALAVDPGRLEARLRLGRLRSLQGRAVEAELPLETVAREATDPRLSYLAWLFLGRLHDQRHRLDRAVDAYERALAAQPDSQAARLGLAWVRDRQAGPQAAHRTLMELLGSTPRPDRAPDPWWGYALGPRELAAAALDRVRSAVMAP
jgi:tetratricopeptide (TPR) repeat protein